MTKFKLKMPLTIVLTLCTVVLLLTAYVALRAGGQQGQISSSGGVALSIPGLEVIQGVEQGGNMVSLSTTLVSQDQEKVNFIVNKLSLAGDGASQALVYTFSPGLPGTMYPQSGQVVIDVSNLASSIRSKKTMDVNSVASSMASPNSIVVTMATKPITVEDSKSTFDLMEVTAATPDGKKSPVKLCSPTTAVFDRSIMKVYVTCGDMAGSVAGIASGAGIEPTGVEGMGPGGGDFQPVGPVSVGSGEFVGPGGGGDFPTQSTGDQKCEWTCSDPNMKYNSQTKKCEADPKTDCGTGFTYEGGKCVANPGPCPNNGIINDDGKCQSHTGCTQDVGFLALDQCFSNAEPSCEQGFSYNSQQRLCTWEYTLKSGERDTMMGACPSGTTKLSETTSQTGYKLVCGMQPSCGQGFTVNTQSGGCSRPACTTGTLKGTHCIEDAKCPTGSDMGNNKKCEKPPDKICDTGTLSADKSKCTANPKCPDECDVHNGKCENPFAFGPPFDPSPKPGNGYSSWPQTPPTQSVEPPAQPVVRTCPPGTYTDASGNCISYPVEMPQVISQPVTYTGTGGYYPVQVQQRWPRPYPIRFGHPGPRRFGHPGIGHPGSHPGGHFVSRHGTSMHGGGHH